MCWHLAATAQDCPDCLGTSPPPNMLFVDVHVLCFLNEYATMLAIACATLLVAVGIKCLVMSGARAQVAPLDGEPPRPDARDAPGVAGAAHDKVPADAAAHDEVPADGTARDEVPSDGTARGEVPVDGAARDEVPVAGAVHDEVPVATRPRPRPRTAKAMARKTSALVTTSQIAACQRGRHIVVPGRNGCAMWLHCGTCSAHATWRWEDGQDWVTYPGLVEVLGPMWDAWYASREAEK